MFYLIALGLVVLAVVLARRPQKKDVCLGCGEKADTPYWCAACRKQNDKVVEQIYGRNRSVLTVSD